ncbi:M23 family metallopeptidase [Parasphingopyxis sp. CP4]|uniref:M23 family metallopeptidase n=1 Tax=Parasphingopyxis sp. CP4 TaxID=2724527 RepID=UPI00210656E6|nr:M23 family metallopeptidase [Parasphingopyxis sp. CP4]
MRRIALGAALVIAAAAMACSTGDASVAQSDAAEAPAMAEQTVPTARRDFVFDGIFRQGGIVRGQVPTGTQRLSLNDTDIPIADDGSFVIGFGRDHGAAATLTAYSQSGAEQVRTLSIASTDWRIERVNASRRGGRSSAEFQRRRAPEISQIVAAREIRSDINGWRQDFMWPVTGRISGVFGSQRIYRGEPGSYHSGVDIARPSGTPIVAPADGVVVLATETPFSLEGYLLIIDHGMGLNSAFLHLSRIDVTLGQVVERGQRIAAIGSSGRATGPHLHWGMKWENQRIDPRFLAGPMPVSGS